MLSGRFGPQHVEEIEDAVQSALLVALERWPVESPPRNPTAWLYRVATNNLKDQLKTSPNRQRLIEENVDTLRTDGDESIESMPGDIQDDMLRMLFVCCDPGIPRDSQIALALKTLCGFAVEEIATRLLTSESNIYKRLDRARRVLKSPKMVSFDPGIEQIPKRLDAVHAVIYQLFSEGYLSSCDNLPIRKELCDEAIRLAELIANHPAGGRPDTFALLALMNLHRARMSARQNASGGLLLLEEQCRSAFDKKRIATGLAWLEKSAFGDELTRYHAEAAIAAEHCLAFSFEETRWDRIVNSYSILNSIAPSPIHLMNQAVAVAEMEGADSGLAMLAQVNPPEWLADSYLWSAVSADLNARSGNMDEANTYQQRALHTAPTDAIRDAIHRRMSRNAKITNRSS